ncbi:hypothetical protein [Helicobacter sp. 11S02596-1]|uniref:hypothetical protein n=1 Tax=Helicobacter sp. 11S02596-1 TaxID=1476194 RepID=UPI000BA6C345|nr:hypothetical protein [Helicobacter sp. 11S02596-1]PAF44855.1 hypothetical protein BJI48_02385 [Helicobacter sp. 11S02596-1]
MKKIQWIGTFFLMGVFLHSNVYAKKLAQEPLIEACDKAELSGNSLKRSFLTKDQPEGQSCDSHFQPEASDSIQGDQTLSDLKAFLNSSANHPSSSN